MVGSKDFDCSRHRAQLEFSEDRHSQRLQLGKERGSYDEGQGKQSSGFLHKKVWEEVARTWRHKYECQVNPLELTSFE